MQLSYSTKDNNLVAFSVPCGQSQIFLIPNAAVSSDTSDSSGVWLHFHLCGGHVRRSVGMGPPLVLISWLLFPRITMFEVLIKLIEQMFDPWWTSWKLEGRKLEICVS